MSLHRSSYKKTTALAAAVGTISLFLGSVILFAQTITIPWISLTLVFHPLIIWSGGLILFALALFSGQPTSSRLLKNHFAISKHTEGAESETTSREPAGWSKMPSSAAAASEEASRTLSRTVSL